MEDFSDIELECAGLVLKAPCRPNPKNTILAGRSTAKPHGPTESGAPRKVPEAREAGEAAQTLPTATFWGSLTYQRAMAIADFAAADLTRWNVIRDYFDAEYPRSQEELARLYRVGQATISRCLASIRTIEKGLNDEYL